MFETIVSLATAPIKAALAIVRVSGADSFSIVSKLFSRNLTKVKERKIFYGEIIDKPNNRVVDQVVLLTYVAPHSFTGEDSIEIICHGSVLIANEIIKLCLANGARMANRGEYSSRAYLNGKLDLVQAEGINDIINATTEESRAQSMFALQGKTSELFRPIKTEIADILSNIEVNIDYPEYEDIEVVSKEQVINSCTKIVKDLNVLIEQGEKDKIYKEGIKVALVGKPNVGKSSLLNALLSEDKAIVTDIAGTTRDIVEGEISINGVLVKLFDTAGYHESTDVIESIGINKTKEAISKSDLVVLLLDEKGIDTELFETVKQYRHIIVTNKSDLINKKDPNMIYISAKNGDVNPLIDKIKEVFDIQDNLIRPSFNNVRQLGLLKKMVEAMKIAIEDAKEDKPIDLIAVNINDAYQCAKDLLGEGTSRDLDDEIFSRFCVGK